jgi:proteasome lid subunit RPN8/RPN11
MSFRRTASAGIIRGGGTASINRSGVTATSDSLPRYYPELAPTYEVALSASAGQLIRKEIEKERYLESAGWLFCDPRDSNLIVCATGPGEDGVLKRSSVQIGESELELVKELAPRLVLCGDWHSHLSADTMPSPADRRAWQRGCELTRSHWIGLVYAPAADMWSRPRCSAWITAGRGEMFCEPLSLREM